VWLIKITMNDRANSAIVDPERNVPDRFAPVESNTAADHAAQREPHDRTGNLPLAKIVNGCVGPDLDQRDIKGSSQSLADEVATYLWV